MVYNLLKTFNMKRCSRCKEEKEMSKFYKDKYHSSGYKSACKKCASLDFTNWRKLNLEEQRKKDRTLHYIRKYNLSVDKAEELVYNRTGICKICSNVSPLVVDHCHTTEKVRGFICSSCNSLLGYSRDNVEILTNAIIYLQDFYNE